MLTALQLLVVGLGTFEPEGQGIEFGIGDSGVHRLIVQKLLSMAIFHPSIYISIYLSIRLFVFEINVYTLISLPIKRRKILLWIFKKFPTNYQYYLQIP